jgi:2-haloacid dehalogenase
MLAGSLPHTVAVLADLKAAGVPLFSLTNWSAETFPIALKRFDFLHWFDDIVVSGAEGVIKPDRRFFDILVERTGLPATSLIFVDDRMDNVVGARNAGLEALQFTTADQLHHELRTLGLPLA